MKNFKIRKLRLIDQARLSVLTLPPLIVAKIQTCLANGLFIQNVSPQFVAMGSLLYCSENMVMVVTFNLSEERVTDLVLMVTETCCYHSQPPPILNFYKYGFLNAINTINITLFSTLT